jgi:hypothetical protein
MWHRSVDPPSCRLWRYAFDFLWVIHGNFGTTLFRWSGGATPASRLWSMAIRSILIMTGLVQEKFHLSRLRIGAERTFRRRRVSGQMIGNFSRTVASSIMPRMFSRLCDVSDCVGWEEKHGTGREIQTGST